MAATPGEVAFDKIGEYRLVIYEDGSYRVLDEEGYEVHTTTFGMSGVPVDFITKALMELQGAAMGQGAGMAAAAAFGPPGEIVVMIGGALGAAAGIGVVETPDVGATPYTIRWVKSVQENPHGMRADKYMFAFQEVQFAILEGNHLQINNVTERIMYGGTPDRYR